MSIWQQISDGSLQTKVLSAAQVFLHGTVLQQDFAIQIIAAAAAYIIAYTIHRSFASKVQKLASENPLGNMFKSHFFSILWMVGLWLFLALFTPSDIAHQTLRVITSLVTAWVFITCLGVFVRDPVWSKFLTVSIWTVAALNIVGLLDATISLLGSVSFTFGKADISALSFVKDFLVLALLLWLSANLTRALEKRFSGLPNLAPSTQVLFGKLFHITFITIAFLIALNMVGIDLTALAVFTGALGVGLGFGLQKVVSNFVSGIILLMEKSVKPGDVIAVDDSYGWVQSLGARYVSVLTRDGIEHIIPNEDFITQKVENWSFSNNDLRLKMDVGISYNSDVELAMQLCLEAVKEQDRVKNKDLSVCFLKGFGDSAVNLELRFWIDDPAEGCENVKSKVYLSIWHKFKKHGIEIPYPQRDLHLRSAVPLTVEPAAALKKKA
jgi:small-conductance mechanosensitive channel